MLVCGSVAAQQAPDAGQLLRQQQTAPQPAAPRTAVPAVSAPASRTPMTALPGSTVRVRAVSFQVVGNTSIASSDLLPLVQEYVGRDLGLAELRAAAEKMAAYYRAQGYFLAQVILPQQDVSAGNITLRVIEGKLKQGDGAIAIKGADRVHPDTIRGFLRAPLPDSGALRQTDLERGILLLNDLPATSVTATVEPGADPETTGLTVTVKDAPLTRGYVSIDNIGNRYTGSWRAGLNLFVDSPTKRGDQITATAMTALNGHFDYLAAGYSTPLGYSGLRVGLNFSTLEYKSGKELANLNSVGDAESLRLWARYPIIRTRPTNLYLNASAEQRGVTSKVGGVATNDKKLNSFTVGLSADNIDAFFGGGVTSGSINFTSGDLNLDRIPGALGADQATARTQGSYTKTNFTLDRLQSLTETIVFQATLNGQIAGNNLDNAEKFSVGGPVGVRAYPAGEGLADTGLTLSLEARKVFIKGAKLAGIELGDIQVAGFYDYGRVLKQYRTLWPGATVGQNAYDLKGIGFGVNMGRARVWDLRIMVARTLGTNPNTSPLNGRMSDGTDYKTRAIVLANFHF